MSHYERTGFQPRAANPAERPSGSGSTCAGDLWMIDHAGSTVLRCLCLEASATGMRLCVPAGYGVAVGQRYELRGLVPGEHPPTIWPAVATSWVTVVQTQTMSDEDRDRLEVGVAVDLVEPAPIGAPRPVASRSAYATSGARAAFHSAGNHGNLLAPVRSGARYRREVSVGSP